MSSSTKERAEAFVAKSIRAIKQDEVTRTIFPNAGDEMDGKMAHSLVGRFDERCTEELCSFIDSLGKNK